MLLNHVATSHIHDNAQKCHHDDDVQHRGVIDFLRVSPCNLRVRVQASSCNAVKNIFVLHPSQTWGT